jgi:hypothetical protein
MEKKAPTPAEVDEKAQEYCALKDALLVAMKAAVDAQIPLEKLKQELIEAVSSFGSAHAEKSKLLHGIGFEVMATFGQSTSIDAAAVERFRVALAESGQARLCAKVFEKTIRWTLQPNSGAIVRGSKLSKSLKALYSQCQVIQPSTPRLAVRAVAPRRTELVGASQ